MSLDLNTTQHTHTFFFFTFTTILLSQVLLDIITEENAADTVIAFDFDLTLKGAVDPITNTPRVRDGERTLKILDKLKEMNVL